MAGSVNQAVLFTKPLHHLALDLTPDQLSQKLCSFLEDKGFRIVSRRGVTGPEMAEREVIRQHYQMYSQGSYGEFSISDAGRERFASAFGKSWDAEVAAGRIAGNAEIMKKKGIAVDELFALWNARFMARETVKVQDGLILAWLEELDCYCINAFYPAMEANFYHPSTQIDYLVVEFDPAEVSWAAFRKTVLGATDAAKAVPESFRGQVYADYPVEFPGRDNFVHGSAGPLEGLIERTIHESGFKLEENPIGHYLLERGIDQVRFMNWKSGQSITELGGLFDATEEKNTAEILADLDAIDFQS